MTFSEILANIVQWRSKCAPIFWFFFLGISYSLPVIFFCSLPLETKFSCKRKEEKGVPICQKYFQFKSATMFSCKGNRKRSSNLSKIHFRFNSKVQQGIEKNSWLTKKPFKNNAKKKSYETFHISLKNSCYYPYCPVSYSFCCTCISQGMT